MFRGTRVSVPLPKFCEKNGFPSQNLTEIRHLVTDEVMAKNDFQYAGRPPSLIVKNHFFHIAAISVGVWQLLSRYLVT